LGDVMTTSIGICNDAFHIQERGLILAYHLYAKSDYITNDKITAHIVLNGKETHTIDVVLSPIIGGKRHRYDLTPYSLLVTDEIPKDELIGAKIYLESNIEFWQSESE